MIKFGTSGWRGIIADDFNFDNLRKVTAAVGKHLKQTSVLNGVVVGYDTRFLGEIFAKEAVYTLASLGIKSFLTRRDTPTPVLSACIIKRKLGGGINITASHNPYNYSGFKFSPSWGGPALPEDTSAIEKYANAGGETQKPAFDSVEKTIDAGLCEIIDPSGDYFPLLDSNLKLKKIEKSGIEIVFDALFGTGRGFLDSYLKRFGINTSVINDLIDPYFRGSSPDPSEKNLSDLRKLVSGKKGKTIGLATDGDADRFGIVDSSGNFIEPNKVIAFLADYLVRTRKFPAGMGVARSCATGTLVDKVAKKYGLKVYVNPVGFKYIGKLISEGKIIIGGEESAGLSIAGHLPEKDGILACLLFAEAVGSANATVEELFDDFYRRIGRLETKRENFHLEPEVKKNLSLKLSKIKDRLMERSVVGIDRTDGVKIEFKGGEWVLFRESGTEPVVRIYGEADSSDDLTQLMSDAKNFLME